MNSPIELSVERQFSLLAFKAQVKKMNLEQAQELLVETYEQMLKQKQGYEHLLKQQWGLADPAAE